MDKAYNNTFETDNIIVNDVFFVSFTENFKYLGSWISYDLHDTFDVESRITKANQAIGALKFFWDSDEVDIRSKYLIYMSILMNLLTWGCESWALTKLLIKKLEVFHMRSIRRILRIKWSDVMEDRIRNSKVRRMFYNINTVEIQIAKRRLTFIGRVVRMNKNKVPGRLIFAWISGKKRPIGRPNQSLRISLLNDIKKIIPTVDNLGSFHTWANFAFCDLTWSMLIHRLGTGNNHNEDWKEKINQDNQLPKDDNYSSPNKASSPNTAPPLSNNSTPLSP